MKKTTLRVVAAGMTLALAGGALEILNTAAPVSADISKALSLTCAGDPSDSAGALGSSAATVEALKKLSGKPLSFDATVSSNAPVKLAAGSPAFDADFTLSISMPDAVTKQAKDTLKLTTVSVPNATFGVGISGAATGTASKSVSIPSISLDGPVSITQTISTKVTPTGTGAIVYSPLPLSLQIGLNSTTPIAIGTLKLTCSATEDIGFTNVLIPGTPNVPPSINVNQNGGTISSTDLMQQITPDDGNPILPGSLKVIRGASAGLGALRGNNLLYFGPEAGGTYNATMQVCGASRPVPAVPGHNLNQEIALPNPNPGVSFLNPHPIALWLKLGDKVAAKKVQLSYYSILGQPEQPTPEPTISKDGTLNASSLELMAGQFRAPSAADMQASIESIPGVGAGNVKVTKVAAKTGEAARFHVEFVGALSNKNLGSGLDVERYTTWLPGELLGVASAALAPAPGASTTTTVVPATLDQINAKLAAGILNGQYGLSDWWRDVQTRIAYELKSSIDGAIPGAVNALKDLLPATPVQDNFVKGVETIPASETGPLCANFQVSYKVAAVPGPSVQDRNETKPQCPRTVTTRVKVTVRGKSRWVRRTNTVMENCCPKTVAKRVKVKVRGKTRWVRQTSTVNVACSTVKASPAKAKAKVVVKRKGRAIGLTPIRFAG
jgi:hypothetical protein